MATINRDSEIRPKLGHSLCTAALVIVTLLALVLSVRPAHAQTLTVLYSFKSNSLKSLDGFYPSYGVIHGPGGHLYGATLYGGSPGFWGTVFEVTPPRADRIIYRFTGGADGYWPSGPLIQDSAGNFYGTTYWGGAFGWGTIFKVDARGKESILYSFADGADGSYPVGRLVQDSSGYLYGAAEFGGVSLSGTIFKLSPTGVLTVLYSFTGVNKGPDGANPTGGLVLDAAGNLFGTTSYGGAFGTQGIAFKINAAGNETILHNFSGGTDGGWPRGDLIGDSSGNIYGSTVLGGVGAGTVFKVDFAGNETVLYSFGTTQFDGLNPLGSVYRDSAGNLYGCTEWGGVGNRGTIYKLDSSGNETVLYGFTGGLDGKYPIGELVEDSSGNLYGTTQQGGAGGNGVVFKLKP